MTSVTRGDLRQLLLAWQTGSIGPEQVHAWAEERYAASGFEPEDEVANEILANLDCLDIDLATLEDVPAFLEMLNVPPSKTEEAFLLLKNHRESVDIEDRKRRYANDPFYSRFCGT